MAFKLKKGLFKVTCGRDNCGFSEEIDVENRIMGKTEEEVTVEAQQIALETAARMHKEKISDHELNSPSVEKLTVIFEAVSIKRSSLTNQEEAIKYKEFKEGEKILKKGELGSTICEVIKGFAFPDRNRSHVYHVGDSFGAAALLVNQVRTADIISGQDGTTIAFYNIKELKKKDPQKAKELYDKAMEDLFIVLTEMEAIIISLEEQVFEEEIKNNNYKEKIVCIEKALEEANQKNKELEKKTKKSKKTQK